MRMSGSWRRRNIFQCMWARLTWALKEVVERFEGKVKKGDLYLLNDPYRGGSHLPDVTAFVPVFAG